MDNRLQFRHNETVFPTREAAIEGFIKTFWENQDENALSLLAEPTVLLYENENDHDPFKKRHPHVILAIGANSNQDTTWNASRYCFIDVHDLYTKIKDNKDNLEAAVKALSAKALDSDSLYFYAQSGDSGTILSGDVRLAEDYRIYNESEERYETLPNNLIIADGTNPKQKGVYMYVDIDYTEGDSAFTFTVSNSNNTITEKKVTLHDNYVVSGEYDIQEQAIKLYFKEGGEPVSIDCTNLINEWVADKGSKTPVILTKEEHKYETNPYTHAQKFQDVLSADIRIKDEILDENGKPKRDDSGHYMKTSGSTNILCRAGSESQSLYVDGTASNIIYYGAEGKTNVKAELDKLNKLRISSDGKNIIVGKNDGFFASVDLEYEKKTKQVGSGYTVIQELILYYSSLDDEGKIVTKSKEIEIPIAQFIDDVYYDRTKEELVIRYIDGKGDVKYTRIPVRDMIEEWDVYNENHSVKLKKDRSIAGKDLLSADVKIVNSSTLANNILEDRNHELYVRGEADNIKYNNAPNSETVKFYIDALSGKLDTEIQDRIADVDEEETRAKDAENFLSGAIDSVSAITDANIQRIDETIGSGFTRDPHENITFKFEKEVAERTTADAALQNSINNEATRATSAETALQTAINTEVTRATNAENALSGAINTEVTRATDKDNEHDAEIAAVSANALSKIVNITSDESLTVTKSVGDNPIVDLKVNLSSESGNTIRLIESEGKYGLYNFVDISYDSGATELTLIKSDLTGGTKTTTVKLDSISFIDEIKYDPSDETLVIIYYSGTTRKEVRIPLRDLINEWDVADDNDNTAIKLRKSTATTGFDILYAYAVVSPKAENIVKIDNDNNALYVDGTQISANTQAIDDEVTRATNAENALQTAITAEETRAQGAEGNLRTDLTAEVTRATNAENALSGAINAEMIRATSAETALQTAINTEVTRAENTENALQTAITAETNRAQGVEGNLRTDLTAETNRATSAETTLQTAITAETNRAQGVEGNLRTDLTAEESRATNAENALSSAINTEATRATSAETALQTAINTEVTRATNAENALSGAINTEVTRATSAEGSLRTDLTAETNRAQGVEGSLRTDLTAETNRAQGVEGSLRTDLTAEVNNRIADVNAEETRAISAETALQTAITAETNRAQGVEGSLRTDLTTEVTRATNAENALQTAIDNEIANRKNEAIHSAEYVDADKKIYLKNFSGDILSTIGVEDFIIDGMINSVYLDNTNRQLVIVFNTDAGERIIKIELNDIFDPDNYYTKNEIDAISGNLQTAINTEVTRATSAETALQTAITAETNRAQGVEGSLRADLTAEVTRATNAENALQTAITAEETRAQGVEGSLRADLTAETNRATNAENALSDAINTEVTRATSAETALQTAINTEKTRAENAETALQTAINTEKTRAQGVEGSLRTDLTAEANRAQGVEGSLRADLTAEVTRATSAETALQTAITAETNRAQGVEGSLRTDLTAETNRATSTETALQTAITAEKTRAENAETALQTAINTEVTRAQGAEGSLRTDLTAETNRAQGVENVITNNLYALSATVETIQSAATSGLSSTFTVSASIGTPSPVTTIYEPIKGNKSIDIKVPNSLQHLTEWNGGSLNIGGNLNVSGTITSNGAIYSSDINLKENIITADFEKKVAANSIDVKQFNFKDDQNKAKVYGIIAQDLEANGLGEIVYTKDDGYKAVDYTSLMMLKIAYLENENKELRSMIEDIKKKLGYLKP